MHVWIWLATQILQHAVYYNTSITYKYRMIVLCLQYHSTELSYDTYVGIYTSIIRQISPKNYLMWEAYTVDLFLLHSVETI